MITHFVCPNCRSDLELKDDEYRCMKCEQIWPIVHGIPRFADNQISWSVFNEDIALAVTDIAEKENWEKAIEIYSHTLGAYTLNYIKDDSRADWHVILPIDSDATVLDIGSGWGNIALGLARWCKQIYCCDVNMMNLRLLRARMRDRGVYNVCSFQYEPNDFMRLPFPDSSINVVILNGVLEWMGVAKIDASPKMVQIEALKEIRRVLSPEGALYIGIENRYSTRTLRGQRIHGELPFVGLLPRWISNLITKQVKGEQHRTYIYSYWGYRQLLHQAGFDQIDFYMPYPSYHHPHYLIPLKPAWIKRYWLDNLSVSRTRKYKIFQRFGLSRLPFHWLSYSFGIRCSK